jgi:hypothetical protein
MPAGVSAYTALANVTLGSSTASVTFSSINQTYRDLVLVVNWVGATTGATRCNIRFNSTTTPYAVVEMAGNGTSALSGSWTPDAIPYQSQGGFTTSTTISANAVFNIQDYSVTDKHKSVLVRSDSSANGTVASACRWGNTAAITSITVLDPQTGNSFGPGSTFALYGVSA